MDEFGLSQKIFTAENKCEGSNTTRDFGRSNNPSSQIIQAKYFGKMLTKIPSRFNTDRSISQKRSKKLSNFEQLDETKLNPESYREAVIDPTLKKKGQQSDYGSYSTHQNSRTIVPFESLVSSKKQLCQLNVIDKLKQHQQDLAITAKKRLIERSLHQS